ncbi:glycosyltransferase family 4 protein [Mucilaginibacter robiniae]|uniref:Glycosyltransferase family 4 protein n=1 Tax=Mucilaginibacter robiniae TaxID=2728022 RepID=A0A7L5E9I5_9SPHI|nr:glycosyltransferase family 4 protein [Mucilaginibacter robiniae]QJD97543.1 glycosyltransferase family 4 protein [Mucilaginibacter robiniae]
MKKKLLFVSHDATRTGAPIVLLRFLKWIKKHDRYDITILLQNGGVLHEDFQEIAPTYMMNKQEGVNTTPARKGLNSIFKRREPVLPDSPFPSELINQHFDLVYLNTSVALTIANDLKIAFQCPVICHVHENEYALSMLFDDGLPEHHVNAVDKFIAVSKSTQKNLVDSYDINEAKISLVYEAVALKEFKKPSIPKEAILEQLNISNNFIIGGAGSTDWRKGVDLFVQLAYWLNKLRPKNFIKLLWLGNVSAEFNRQYQYEAKRLNVTDSILFIGSKEDPQNYFQVFDVFALTSREDPFPLVALEAAALSKPIVFFDQSGGIPELIVNDHGGIKVPYGDILEMAKSILELADDYILRILKGSEASQIINKYDIAIIGEQIITIIDSLVKVD